MAILIHEALQWILKLIFYRLSLWVSKTGLVARSRTILGKKVKNHSKLWINDYTLKNICELFYNIWQPYLPKDYNYLELWIMRCVIVVPVLGHYSMHQPFFPFSLSLWVGELSVYFIYLINFISSTCVFLFSCFSQLVVQFSVIFNVVCSVCSACFLAL